MSPPYSLTYLRLAAFIWMLLVATGLVLILIQIIKLKKPNSWLVTANAISLALVLYGCCFVNAPRLVASYNVEHSRENGGTGPRLDLQYLVRSVRKSCPSSKPRLQQDSGASVDRPGIAAGKHYETRRRPANWRGMDFRTWRLHRYLANNPDITQKSLDSGKG